MYTYIYACIKLGKIFPMEKLDVVMNIMRNLIF